MSGQIDFHHMANEKQISNRNFGFLFSAIIIGFACLPLRNGGYIHIWLLTIGIILLVVSTLFPEHLEVLKLTWFKLGLLLNTITSPIFLFLIFYFIITPFGIVMRRFNKNILSLNQTQNLDSYWIIKSADNNYVKSMRNQF